MHRISIAISLAAAAIAGAQAIGTADSKAFADAIQGNAEVTRPEDALSPGLRAAAAAAAEADRDPLGRRGKPHFLNPRLRRNGSGGRDARCREAGAAERAECRGNPEADRPLFRDDFQAGNMAAWTPAAGTWKLPASVGANRMLRSDSSDASAVIAGHEGWADYSVQSQVVLEAGSGEAGLLGRVQSGQHYYELALGRDGAGKQGWSIRLRHHEHRITLASGPFDYRAGQAYTLRFDLRGSRLRGSIAAPGKSSFQALGEAEDASWSQGAIGLRSEGAPASFDAVAVNGVMAAAAAGPWGPKMILRDVTGSFPVGIPDGGWWVTPIHATLLPASGKVLITGWGRRDPVSCDKAGGGARKNGTTFLLDPAAMTPDTARTLYIQPISEQNLQASDVLYCAGHNTLADGRILFTGGSRYANLGGIGGPEVEDGINYSRIYDPAAGSFARITQPMLGGPLDTRGVKWYPTNLLLPDGNTLITGGFKQCCQTPQDWNLSVELFNPDLHASGANPWSMLLQHEEGNLDMPPTRGYTNLFVLPQPVPAASAGGIARPLAMFAGAGKVLLFSHASGLAASQRFFSRPNAVVPSPAAVEKGEGAAGALLPDGKLAFLSGSADGTTAEKVHFYDPLADTWSQLSTGVSRHFGNNVLLPDGTLLAINGYKLNASYIGDVRQPQIVDPVARTVTTLPAWDNDVLERGYHSFAVLLKDGRILIGGGTAAGYAVACERADARVFSPPYLTAGERPAPSNLSDGLVMSVGGGPITVKYTGGAVRAARGAVLMAPGSVTHAFDMGQRYVPLVQASPSAGTLTLTPPPNTTVAPPGEYLLFLIGQASTPSMGIHVRLRQLPPPWQNGDIGTPGFPGSALHVSGKFTVRGSGADIWGAADQFQFVRRPIAGDGSITARVTGIVNTNAWAKAGVMIRESTAAGSRHAFMTTSFSSGVSFQRRLQTGQASTSTTAPANGRTWVRLTRAGNVFTAYASANGTTWDLIGSQTITMASGASMGLAITSHNNAATTQADFQNITAVE